MLALSGDSSHYLVSIHNLTPQNFFSDYACLPETHDAINMVPCIDPVGGLVLNANPSNIDTVFIAGRVVKKSGKLLGVDWPILAEKMRNSSTRIVEGFHTIDKKSIEDFAASLMLEDNEDRDIQDGQN